ncbi:hypothetical protein DT075_35190 [Bacillus licheniformis]|nr:hypothetical protein DT075_35190 [Bacillus licheniformis]
MTKKGWDPDKPLKRADFELIGAVPHDIVPQQAFAHGFIEKPGSRAALCSEAFGFLNLNCGSVMYEPQSLEAKKGFPHSGPADGQIASAGGL